MASVEYDLDTSGGLMPQIQALLAPPSSEDGKKQRKEKDRTSFPNRRPGRAVNRDTCDSCKEGGDLICCDNCPAAFHLLCHDPPLDEDDLPTGEWLCHQCRYFAQEKVDDDVLSSKSNHSRNSNNDKYLDQDLKNVKESYNQTAALESDAIHDNEREMVEEESPLQTLIRVATLMNPKQFNLPNELQCTTVLPGNYLRPNACNKRLQKKEGNKSGAKKVAHELDNGIVPLPAKVCFECRKSCLRAPLIQCDFCPLLFHQDCLDPPLTTLPTGRWMCPNHVENILDQKLLGSCSLSERVKLWNRFTGRVSQDTVKIDFLKKIHRQHPPFRYKIKLPPRNRVQVPNAVKEHYRCPPKLYPRVNEPMNLINDCKYQPNNVETHLASMEEQEMWLSNLVSLQTSIARFMTQKELKCEKKAENSGNIDPKIQTPNYLQSSQNQSNLTNRIINGDLHISTNNKLNTDINCRTNILPETPISNIGNFATKTIPVSQKMDGKYFKSSNNIHLSNCDSTVNRVNSFSPLDSSISYGAPKYPFSSRTSVTNSVNTVQMKSPVTLSSTSRLQQTSTVVSNPCSEFSNSSTLPSINIVPVNLENPLEDKLTNDSAKYPHLNNILRTSIEDNIEVQLSQLDEKLVHVLAYQRLQQLMHPQLTKADSNINVASQVTNSTLRSRAALTPINGTSSPSLMTYRVFSIGTGDDMDMSLNKYGYCNYTSSRHACIFYDEMTKQFELLNYSEHGTSVDNVIYSCDFSEKNSVSSVPTSVVTAIRTIIDKYRGKSGCNVSEKLTMTSQSTQTAKSCNCKSSFSGNFSNNATAGGGWEGAAVLHHGSILRFGCLNFVFSITESATREALFMMKKPESANHEILTMVPQMMAMSNSTFSCKQLNNSES